MKEDLRKRKTEYVKKRRQHKHNLNVKGPKSGEMLVSQRKGKFRLEDYGPCTYCKEWTVLKT
jgi:hypothetical protein